MRFEEASGLAPGGGLPVVFAFFLRDPGRQRLVEVRGERENVRLVHAPEFDEAGIGGGTVVKFQTVLGENVANVSEFGGGEAVLRKRARGGAKDLRKIDDGVTGDGEGEFGLTFASAIDADHDERAGIENGSERSDPGLVVMLRAEIGENRIAEMAFHQFGGPEFPFF